MFSEIRISTSWQNNFWLKLHFLNNAFTVCYKLKATAAVIVLIIYMRQLQFWDSVTWDCSRSLEQQKPFPEWLQEQTMSHRKSVEFTHRYAHRDGAQFPSSPGQLQLIASANEWLGPIFTSAGSYGKRGWRKERGGEGDKNKNINLSRRGN